ncbi:hypothetical protein JZ751_015615 [Albula glossodonta]|uniref:Uncharacterized protein n=1 Tax=Albula glossodonta TaxID=121402 RepID=A0A8T2NPG7_9TELE|nr:hypothetical protein JZ751_015615 [Albula glossodonta]
MQSQSAITSSKVNKGPPAEELAAEDEDLFFCGWQGSHNPTMLFTSAGSKGALTLSLKPKLVSLAHSLNFHLAYYQYFAHNNNKNISTCHIVSHKAIVSQLAIAELGVRLGIFRTSDCYSLGIFVVNWAPMACMSQAAGGERSVGGRLSISAGGLQSGNWLLLPVVVRSEKARKAPSPAVSLIRLLLMTETPAVDSAVLLTVSVSEDDRSR